MRISKNTKIFLIIFSALALLITVSAILYKKYGKEDSSSQIIIESPQKVPDLNASDIYEQNSNLERLTLSDNYSNNGLTYQTVKDEGRDINVEYIQISGLKDDSVQENINSQIRERINKILDSNNFKKHSDQNAYVKTSVEANFSDVLSVKIFVQFKENFNKSYGLNFRLSNGEKLKLDDLFTYDAPKRNIITSAAYRAFALKYYTDEGISNDFYTNIEDDVFGFLENYNNGEITEFSFTPLTIDLYKEGNTVSIDMTKYYNDIAIYTDFVSNGSLYKSNENVATKIPVFVKRPESLIDLYDKVSDTCIIDVIIYGDDDFSTKEKDVIEKYRKDLEREISSYKTQKGIYYANYVKVSRAKENDENILMFDEEESIVKSNENKFQNEIYSKIIMAERDINNLNYSKSKINILDESLIEKNSNEKKYSLKTEKRIENEEEDTENVPANEENNGNTENSHDSDNNAGNVVQPSPVTTPPTEEPVQTTVPSSSTSPSPSPSASGEMTTRVYF